jgi:hypothetical protein
MALVEVFFEAIITHLYVVPAIVYCRPNILFLKPFLTQPAFSCIELVIAAIAKYPVRLYEDVLVLPQHAKTVIAFRPPILFRSHDINENTLIIASKIAPLIPVSWLYPKVPPYASFLGTG